MNAANPVRLIAHRCKGFEEEENSVFALRKALRSPVDEIEIDARLTRDKKFTICHLPWYRCPGGSYQFFSAITADTAIAHGRMMLDQALSEFSAFSGDKRLRVEVKSHGEEQQLIALVRKYRLENKIVIVSWNAEVLRTLRRLAPEVALSFSFIAGLQGTGFPLCLPWRVPAVVLDSALGLESVNIVPLFPGIPRTLIACLKRLDTAVIIVGCSTSAKLEALRECGVWGVLTAHAPRLMTRQTEVPLPRCYSL